MWRVSTQITGRPASLRPFTSHCDNFIFELTNSVAADTINRFCGSSMQAIHQAAGAIKMGAGEVFICAGIESMSRVMMGGFNPML